jgi:hypothetical protein
VSDTGLALHLPTLVHAEEEEEEEGGMRVMRCFINDTEATRMVRYVM